MDDVIKQILVIICILFLTIITYCGCIEDNKVEIDKFVGKWTSEDKENYPYIFGSQIIFDSDGTAYTGSQEEKVKFELNNDKIIIINNEGTKGTACDYIFSENNTKLTVYDPSWDIRAVYNKDVTINQESSISEETNQEINKIEEYSNNLCFKYRF